MNPKRKLLLGGLVLAMGVGYLGFTGVQSGWVYFVDVDALVEELPPAGKRVRVHGDVGTEGLDVRRADLEARFDLLGAEGGRLRVAYTGAVPDMFDAGRQVVVEGALDEAGVFQADVLMTKCASKYEGHGENGPVRAGEVDEACEPAEQAS